MATMILSNFDRICEFDIFKDDDCPEARSFNWSLDTYKNKINQIIDLQNANNVFEQVDLIEAYRFLLFRHNKNVDKWFKQSLFTIYQCKCDIEGSDNFYYIVNNRNHHLDNVVFKRILDNIDKHIKNDDLVYGCSGHAITRAMYRIGECVSFNNKYKTEQHVVRTINRRSYSAKPKKKYEVLSLINHNFETATYRMDSEGNVYVISNHTVLTVHCNESERWTRN